MSADSSGLSDEVRAELNPTGPGSENDPQPAPLDAPAPEVDRAELIALAERLGG